MGKGIVFEELSERALYPETAAIDSESFWLVRLTYVNLCAGE